MSWLFWLLVSGLEKMVWWRVDGFRDVAITVSLCARAVFVRWWSKPLRQPVMSHVLGGMVFSLGVVVVWG